MPHDLPRFVPPFGRRAALLGAIGLSGAAALPGAARAQGRTLRVRIGADVSQLDPARIFQIENQAVAGNIYSGLVKYDEATNRIVDDISTGHEITDDGKSWTFQLRPNVTWHKNYGPFTADDVVFSFERVLDPATSSPYRAQLTGLQKVEAVDPLTVRFTLDEANSGFLHKLCAFNQGWLVSRRAVTELGTRYSMNPVGTGPFAFDRWTAGSEVRLLANKEYFGGAPAMPDVSFRIIRDETAAAIALEKGEIDIFFGLQQPEVIERLKQAQSVRVLDRPSNSTLGLVLNMAAGPLRDVRVRRAIAHALNRPGLIDGFFRGTKLEATSVLTPTFQEYSTDGVPLYPYDPAKARALLQEAGVSNMRLEITAVALSPYDRIPVLLVNDLQQVGIQATVRVLERAAFMQARSSGNVQSVTTAVVGPPDPDSTLVTLLHSRSSPPGLNTARYNGVDDLLARAARTTDMAARKAAYAEILRKTMEDLPVIPLYADRLYLAHGAAVKGLVQNSLFTLQVGGVSLGSV